MSAPSLSIKHNSHPMCLHPCKTREKPILLAVAAAAFIHHCRQLHQFTTQ